MTDFNAEVTVSAYQHVSSSELKSLDSLYKAFTILIREGGMPEELTTCLTYTENGYNEEVLMSYLSCFGFLFVLSIFSGLPPWMPSCLVSLHRSIKCASPEYNCKNI